MATTGAEDVEGMSEETDGAALPASLEELLVATAERVGALVERGRLSLAHVATLVVDQADALLATAGGEAQLRTIAAGCRAEGSGAAARQTLLLCGTHAPPLLRLAHGLLLSLIHI